MRARTELRAGFTVIEVLVATALFAIVVLVVLAPLTGLFGLTQKSSRQVSATNLAQQATESIRGQWQNANHVQYDLNCVIGPLVISAARPGAAVEVTALVRDGDARGTFAGPAAPLTVGTKESCPAAASAVPGGAPPPGPPMREVTITATTPGAASVLVVEVAR